MPHILSVLFVVAAVIGCRHLAGELFDPRVARTLPGDERAHELGIQKYPSWEHATWSPL